MRLISNHHTANGTMPFGVFAQIVLSVQHKSFYVVMALARSYKYVIQNWDMYLYQAYFHRRRATRG